MFRFGAITGGKPIPVVPDSFGNGVMPDKMGGVMVYIDKKPPVLVQDEGLELDGKLVDGVPYYGDPMRGGVRVYVDDRLSVALKPQSLDEFPSERRARRDEALEARARCSSRTASICRRSSSTWLIADERRKQQAHARRARHGTSRSIPSARTRSSSVTPSCAASALALHSHALSPSELARDSPRRRRELIPLLLDGTLVPSRGILDALPNPIQSAHASRESAVFSTAFNER